MASTQTSLINHNFGGIRRKDSMFSEDKITCSDCQNVELYYTELNSAVGIRTSKGNASIGITIPEGEEVIGLFDTIQNGTQYYIVYTEDGTNGKLYIMDIVNKTLSLKKTLNNCTGKAQGENFHNSLVDAFVFSNGEDLVYIYTNVDYVAEPLVIAGDEPSGYPDNKKLVLNLTGRDGNTVKGLGLVNLYGRLWIFNGNKVWWSNSPAIADFYSQTSPTDANRAGYWEASKDITAIHEYLGSLAVFHKDSSCLIVEDNPPESLFKATDESPGGCASYDSLVFHGTDLFFYDDTKKGVFSFQQVINGDKTLGDNIAYDIQDELLSIRKDYLHKIRTLSVVTSDRNEVWFLLPIESTYTIKIEGVDVAKPASIIMIYDYVRGEWVKRKCQKINCISVLDSVLYSGGDNVYVEYSTNSFNGDYIQNYYQCTIMNLGTDNTLKITKFPPRLTIDAASKNHFFVKYIKNYQITKKPKIKELQSKSFGNVMVYNSGDKYSGTKDGVVYDFGKIFKPGSISGIIKMPSASFKAIEITFYTMEKGQEFVIKALEFSRIKVKQI